MTKERLIDCIAPCGLMCYTCLGFRGGAIGEHSAMLLKLNEGFREFLNKQVMDMEEYDRYIEKLKADANPSCPGCRKNNGKDPVCIKECFIPNCVKEHNIDFCGECEAFPCKKIEESNLYGEEIKKGFYEGSLLIKEQGAERFFEIKKDMPHYIHYVK